MKRFFLFVLLFSLQSPNANAEKISEVVRWCVGVFSRFAPTQSTPYEIDSEPFFVSKLNRVWKAKKKSDGTYWMLKEPFEGSEHLLQVEYKNLNDLPHGKAEWVTIKGKNWLAMPMVAKSSREPSVPAPTVGALIKTDPRFSGLTKDHRLIKKIRDGVLDELEKMHIAGKVHCDVSRNNIVVKIEEGGVVAVKLIDLATARPPGPLNGAYIYRTPLYESRESIEDKVVTSRRDVMAALKVFEELKTNNPEILRVLESKIPADVKTAREMLDKAETLNREGFADYYARKWIEAYHQAVAAHKEKKLSEGYARDLLDEMVQADERIHKRAQELAPELWRLVAERERVLAPVLIEPDSMTPVPASAPK